MAFQKLSGVPMMFIKLCGKNASAQKLPIGHMCKANMKKLLLGNKGMTVFPLFLSIMQPDLILQKILYNKVHG